MFSVIGNLFKWFVGFVPSIYIPIITIPKDLIDIVNAVWYFLPMGTIWNLFLIGLGITVFRFALSVIIRLKSFIPTMGA